MSILNGVGIQFNESMSGYLGVGEADPKEGAAIGRRENNPVRFDVQIRIPDMDRFLNISEQRAQLSGTVECASLGGPYEIYDAHFNLFQVALDTGFRNMAYHFKFKAADGNIYYLKGVKEIHDDPGLLDVVDDMTRLFTTIHRGEDEEAPVYGSGEMYFKLWNAPALVSSVDIIGNGSFLQR